MKRRDAIKSILLAAALPACGDPVRSGDLMLPPWHMWGTSVTTDLSIDTNALTTVSTQQLADIRYGRPESWRFMMVASLNSLDAPNPAASAVFVNFKLIFGVGRSQSSFNQWVNFEFDPPYVVFPIQRYAGTAKEPPRVPGDAAQRLIEIFPAQTIQCNADIIVQPGGAGITTANVTVAAYFSPNVHTRPEWFEHRFPGDETEGH